MIKCPVCKGLGIYRDKVVGYTEKLLNYPCLYCSGKKTVTFLKWFNWQTVLLHYFLIKLLSRHKSKGKV